MSLWSYKTSTFADQENAEKKQNIENKNKLSDFSGYVYSTVFERNLQSVNLKFDDDWNNKLAISLPFLLFKDWKSF